MKELTPEQIKEAIRESNAAQKAVIQVGSMIKSLEIPKVILYRSEDTREFAQLLGEVMVKLNEVIEVLNSLEK